MMNLRRVSAIIVSGAALVTAIATTVVWYWLSRVDAGVCIKEGRVLSKEELRKAVLQSYADHMMESIRAYSGDGLRIGIIQNPEETEIRKLIDRAYLKEGPFVENFGIESYDHTKNIQVENIKEPFILMRYSTYVPEFVTGVISTGFQASDDDRLIQHLRFRNPEFKNRTFPSFYEHIIGFGKHYFKISDFQFNRECCGNDIKKNSDHTQAKQLIRKEKAYRQIQSEGIGHDFYYAPVSNCGKIMRYTTPYGPYGNNLKDMVKLVEMKP
jgi:hypothetical protein